jgi:hypothetical protein
VILHDLAIPGSRANLDHLVIGPGGVFMVDPKQYRGRLQVAADGSLWHGRYPLAPILRVARFEADQAAHILAVNVSPRGGRPRRSRTLGNADRGRRGNRGRRAPV